MIQVLLIEDNVQNAYLARYLLENAGMRVVSHANAKEGFAAALAHPPTVILLDIQLPDLDGYTLARNFRTEQVTRDIPIVALSSFAMPGEKKRALEAGCNGYIEKPIRALSFADIVKGFLRPKDLQL